MAEVLQWVFDGVGTMILGLILGAAGGGSGAWLVAKRRYQSQRAGHGANQIQAGRDVKL